MASVSSIFSKILLYSDGVIMFFLNVVQVADRNKIAVGGHSYGAFMTANLLIHASDLFACGIARSGAYNRTLTPFGFQVCQDMPPSTQLAQSQCLG